MISVIIPAYNSAGTIHRCVQSVLCQTYKEWEMLIVDDGSKDDTLDICKSFDDSRIKVLHKENGGVSSARNMGLNAAKGEYIAFIDSDDYINTDYLKHLSEGFGYDIVVTGFSYGLTPESSAFKLQLSTKQEVGKDLSNLINADQFCFPWGRLFKRSIIEQHQIRFDEQMRFAEDNVFNWEFLCHAESIFIDSTKKDYCKSADDGGSGYNLSFEEMEYVDSQLFKLANRLELYYNVPLNLETKQLMHVLFLKDMLQLTASQWYEYYKKYHAKGTKSEGYNFIMQTIYYMTLAKISQTKDKRIQKQMLKQLDCFIDKPLTMLTVSSIKTRLLIPFIKMKLYAISLRFINKTF